jgi:hypothetical protein
MKKFSLPLMCLFLSVSLSGCGLFEDAFKAGIIFALILVAIVGLVIWLLRMVIKLIFKQPVVRIIEA